MEAKQLEKIARMALSGITQDDIGKVFQVSGSYISQVMALPEYQLKEQEIATVRFEEQDTLNRGWDAVEAKGVSVALAHLRAAPDPEFALKAAAVANRASRRGSVHHNTPINPTGAGPRSVINLNATFVQKVQNNFQIDLDKKNGLEQNKKDSNFLAPKAVQELLTTKDDDETKLFDASRPVTTAQSESVEKDLEELTISTLVD